jgi:hypothetical protein
MVAFTYRMGHGVAGDLTRQSQATIEPQIFGATPFPAYGRFGKLVAGKLVPIGAGDTAALIHGLLLRPFPITGASPSDPLATAVPPTSGAADVLRRGWALVKNNAGAPAINGAVHIRVLNGTANQPIGGIEATSTADTITVANCKFSSPADANGIAEIEYSI